MYVIDFITVVDLGFQKIYLSRNYFTTSNVYVYDLT